MEEIKAIALRDAAKYLRGGSKSERISWADAAINVEIMFNELNNYIVELE